MDLTKKTAKSVIATTVNKKIKTVKAVDKNEKMGKIVKIVSQGAMILGIALTVYLVIFGLKSGIFTDQAKLTAFITKAGPFGPLLFTGIQITQTVLPVIPGGLTSAAGVLLFGAIKGFALNYVGNVIGSILCFIIARRYGKSLVQGLIGEATYDKYEGKILNNPKFLSFFNIAIFLPFFPDDALCYLMGLTKIDLKKYTILLILLKPFNILLYSIGLTQLLQFVMKLFV